MTDRGPVMQIYTGRRYYPLAPLAEDVCMDDIAPALAQTCRYTGHTHGFFSVAQHSVLVSEEVSPEHAALALLHDAAEAYVGDWCRPMKHPPNYAGHEEPFPGIIKAVAGMAADWFRRVEQANRRAIHEALGLPWPVPPAAAAEIAELDTQILHNESRDVLGGQAFDWGIPGGPIPGLHIRPAPPATAEILFRARWEQVRPR